MSYPHVTQFESVDRRARLMAAKPRDTTQVRAIRRRLRRRRGLAPQPC